MNPVINSLTQSPFVREISHVKSRVGSYVHGMSDNVPPFAHHKVVVKPYNNPSKVTQAASHKFKIPQEGTLNRAYLRIKMINKIPIPQDIVEEDDYDAPFHDKNDQTLQVDSVYTAFKAKHRIPWIHDCQTNSPFRGDQPFGSGGAQVVFPKSITDPEDMTINTSGNINYASRSELIQPENYLGTASNGWNAINILDTITLKSGNKIIEHVHPETIPAEVIRMPKDLRDFYLRGMVGWSMGTETGAPLSEPDYRLPWDPTACRRDAFGRLETNFESSGLVTHMQDEDLLGQPIIYRNQHANFIVPLPLSSLKTLKKNYQTRFVEEMELEVATKELLRGFNEYDTGVQTSYHDVELVLHYHNWHDNIESEIRSVNYKQNIPASVYSTEWIRDGVTHAVVSNTLPLEIPIKSRQLITEMLIVTRSKSAFSTAPETFKRRKSDYTLFFHHGHTYKVALMGAGRTLWEGTNIDLLGPDSADYDLVGRKLAGGDVAYGGIRNVKHAHALQGVSAGNTRIDSTRMRTSYKHPTQCGVDYSFGDNMALLRFGLQTGDEFFSGGMALQTISNVKLIITPPADAFSATHGAEHSSWVGREIEFEVYVKNVNMTHIDSNTGAITRSVDV